MKKSWRKRSPVQVTVDRDTQLKALKHGYLDELDKLTMRNLSNEFVKSTVVSHVADIKEINRDLGIDELDGLEDWK